MSDEQASNYSGLILGVIVIAVFILVAVWFGNKLLNDSQVPMNPPVQGDTVVEGDTTINNSSSTNIILPKNTPLTGDASTSEIK